MPPPEPREFPWWLAALGTTGAVLLVLIVADPTYRSVLSLLATGISVTIFVTVVAFVLATALGLVLAVCAVSGNTVLRQTARFYVEVMRGVPILVLLLYVAFVGVPAAVAGWNALAAPLGLDPLQTRDVSMLARAVVALALAYSAFLAEIFRAGIQAVDPGQVEAAKALGLHRWARFRCVVLPQALRIVLPPLGNDFIALIKDSALVSVLGVADVTQLGKLHAASSFRYMETYNVVAFLYLTMTIGLSLALRALEKRLRRRLERRP